MEFLSMLLPLAKENKKGGRVLKPATLIIGLTLFFHCHYHR
jgi:hypothetical protein